MVIAGVVLAVLGLAAGGAAFAGAQAQESDASRVVSIVQGSDFRSYTPEELPEQLRLVSKVLGKALEKGMFSEPVSLTKLPSDIAEKVRQAVEAQGGGEARIIYTVKMKDGYDVLVRLQADEGVKHFEAVVTGDKVEITEITPQLVEQYTEEELVEEFKDVEDERIVATITKTSKGTHRILELKASAQQVGWYYAEWYIEGKNIFGITLWKLCSAGDFYVVPGVHVLDVIDKSYPYANGWLGWSVKYFSSSTYLHPALLYGQVSANGGFSGPFEQSVDAWSWVRVYYDLTVIGDAGTY
ncbi:hypothetical protein M1N58_01015 [Dehalococcoidales bacterium]|nr:hypothetical protein [Dehalococcoidales bacterium]